jgi:hypothetical protein
MQMNARRLACVSALVAVCGAAQAWALIGDPSAPDLLPGNSGMQRQAVPLLVDPSSAGIGVIRACLVQLADAGSTRISEQCPQLLPAMRQLGLTEGLPSGWEKRLTRRTLEDLLALLQRYRGNPPTAAPSATLLAPILQGLRAGSTPHSWWEDFKERLRRLLEGADSEDGTWVAQLLSAIPRLLQRVMLYGSLAAVAAVALWILWKELLVNLSLARRQASTPFVSGAQPSGLPVSAFRGELTLADVDAAPPAERASLLLRLLLQSLHRSGRLRGERALTCRELSEQAAFDSLEQRRSFLDVARWAERERYAAAAVLQARAYQQGRALYVELAAAARLQHGGAD